jgi:hypothetical protein
MTAAFDDSTTNAIGLTFSVPMLKRWRWTSWSVVVESGCDDVKITVAVPLPEVVAGNWPLSATPEEIADSPIAVADPPTLTL